MKRLLPLLLLAAVAAPAQAEGPRVSPTPPLNQNGGAWPSGHVQGVAVDLKGGYIYYSFTNLLAKYDFQGRLVGTLVGWTGHLGDLDFNPADGKVYGSLEYKADKAFYIAVIDAARLDRVGVQASASDLFRTVYLSEVAEDYAADVNGDGRFDGDDGRFRKDAAASPDHRFGCSGIDGVAFGPAFGRTDGKRFLTVAYGIYGSVDRADNDHQILLQYDVAGWGRLARPLTEAAPHRSGPAEPRAKVFVRTGNTTYGVQNLAYDSAQQRWFMGVYRGRKPGFPNYGLFAVEARARPVEGDLVGVTSAAGEGWARGALLPLAADGLRDPATGVRGWNQKADVGMQPLGDGLWYLAANGRRGDLQTADLTLMRWTGDPHAPFAPVMSIDR
ncbi:hypothetical protein [Phenylobacterium deserti]|uniref:Uncharacterized protein n=1 Tax=Phenylobacterium deserti TaxID=1914756 RepID=A0A328AHA5_9CAUL|nr:hypothetical protein [Phenylobacterium deserti]RAK52744.1 hypothetical protein DJ018_11185 [Phenylobacterium deserti]